MSPSPRTMKSTPQRRVLVDVRREAGIVAADDDARVGPQRAHERDDLAAPSCRWKVMIDSPTTSGLELAHQALDGVADRPLHEDQVGDGDVVVRIDVAGERASAPFGIRIVTGGGVLERVRHREQEDVHANPRSDAGARPPDA